MKMIALLLLALTACGSELPTISATAPAVQAYDLGATAPWMPLLWNGCTVTVPAGASRCQLVAQLISGTNLAFDGSDLLGLRDGLGVTVNGLDLSVAGKDGTWSGVCSGGGSLVATFNPAVEPRVLRLLCQQLHYANLGGIRAVSRRRIAITIHAWVGGQELISAPLTLDIDGVGVDQPPKLRFETLSMSQGGSADWAPVGCYDGRQATDTLRWHVDTLSAGLSITGLNASGRVDLSATLRSGSWPLSYFSSVQLQLHSTSGPGTYAYAVVVSDGTANATVNGSVSVTPPSGELEILGDFPFSVTGNATFTFSASRPDARLLHCTEYPSIGNSVLINPHFFYTANGSIITVSVFPEMFQGMTELAGCAVFTASDSTFRLPYRIQLPAGTNN